MKKYIVFIIAALFAFAASAASIHTKAADASPALRVYNGHTGTVTIVIQAAGAGGTNTVTLDGKSNVIDGSDAIDTIAEFASAIAGCTNLAGYNKLTIDADCSLAGDSTDGELLTGTYTATAGNWLEIPWDTSAALFYSVYIADDAVIGSLRAPLTVKKIGGNPVGTGAVTASLYVDGTLTWQKVLPEPSGIGGVSNDTITVISNYVDLPVDVDAPVGRKAVIVRVSRATTATTGNVNVLIE